MEVNNDSDEANSKLDIQHAEIIRDSANKLRRIVEANNLRNQKTNMIDLTPRSSSPRYEEAFQMHKKGEAMSVDSVNAFILRSNYNEKVKEVSNFQQFQEPQSMQTFEIKNYDSKVTFSGDENSTRNIANNAADKLERAENLISQLQSQIESNAQGYKEKYSKMVKEIQELEEGNISLHQLVKSKINEIQELKNDNIEVKHKIASHNMMNQKLNITEEELRNKIEEMMNKNTELNFIIRQKEEELQNSKRKASLLQIDINNSNNVESSLNNEIMEYKKNRNEAINELQFLKDEN